MNFPSDISRCHGTASHCCTDCARRLQIPRDNLVGWYPYMEIKPVRNHCGFKILEKKNDSCTRVD